MALIQKRVCDLDGTTPAEQVAFTVDGVSYLIDLSERRVSELTVLVDGFREAIRPFVEKAQVVNRPKPTATRRSNSSGVDLREVREWARANNYVVADKGRVPVHVVQRYSDALAREREAATNPGVVDVLNPEPNDVSDQVAPDVPDVVDQADDDGVTDPVVLSPQERGALRKIGRDGESRTRLSTVHTGLVARGLAVHEEGKVTLTPKGLKALDDMQTG